jgi:hypothetical protein
MTPSLIWIVSGPGAKRNMTTGPEHTVKFFQHALGIAEHPKRKAAQYVIERRTNEVHLLGVHLTDLSVTRISVLDPCAVSRTMFGAKSIPVTCPVRPTRAAAGNNSAPLPAATSSTLAPFGISAASTSCDRSTKTSLAQFDHT